MGRKKSYVREDVTRQAMDLFWRHGFSGTSTKMLSEATGLNPFSIFAEFGTKQGLFEAAMAVYLAEVETIFARLNSPDAVPDDIRALLGFYSAFAASPRGECGCFLTNVATDRGADDPATKQAVDTYLGIITSGLENCLRLARQRGELHDGVVVSDEARLLTSIVLGFFVLMRAGAEPAVIAGAIRAAELHLDALQICERA